MVKCMSDEEKQEEVSENIEEKVEEKPVEEVAEENVETGDKSEETPATENNLEESAPKEEEISEDVETTAGEEVREEAPPIEEKKEESPVRAELPKPVAVGDELDVTIESVGAKGDGIAKKDGFVIFIAEVNKGETVRIKITELKSSFAIGEKV